MTEWQHPPQCHLCYWLFCCSAMLWKGFIILLSQKTIKGSHGLMFTLIIVANLIFLLTSKKYIRWCNCCASLLHENNIYSQIKVKHSHFIFFFPPNRLCSVTSLRLQNLILPMFGSKSCILCKKQNKYMIPSKLKVYKIQKINQD